MEVISSVPVTLDERLGFGRELRIPASWEEFLDMLEECEYRIEYDEGEIISYMGYATEEHETLVGEIIRLLGNLLSEMACRVNGSNLALHIPGFVNRHYNADCAVVQGASEKVILRGDMTAVANPVLIVEVLSPSNRDYDLSRKFKNYKKIPSLQQVLFIESTEIKVASHFRHDDWAPQVFDLDQKAVPILNAGTISIEELYRKVAIG
ncbi:MAG: Uma2 family endonuclease [Saprospiraceae bacterium]|nr:Uma2 family endonuclease [Saprospiraceae bacterium]